MASTTNTHSSVKKNISSTLVSMSMDKSGSKLGPLVTPAVWIYDYSKNKKTPDIGDISIYAGGLFSGPAGIVTGLFKSVVEDDIETKLNHVKSVEPKQYRDGIKSCHSYGNSSPSINAMAIAGLGTTVWQHPIGIWVYVTDSQGGLIVDYKPVNPVVVYRPKIPLVKSRAGGYVWSSHKK